jgi:hypothetical protein
MRICVRRGMGGFASWYVVYLSLRDKEKGAKRREGGSGR